jgi:hypothetical protein
MVVSHPIAFIRYFVRTDQIGSKVASDLISLLSFLRKGKLNKQLHLTTMEIYNG